MTKPLAPTKSTVSSRAGINTINVTSNVDWVISYHRCKSSCKVSLPFWEEVETQWEHLEVKLSATISRVSAPQVLPRHLTVPPVSVYADASKMNTRYLPVLATIAGQ